MPYFPPPKAILLSRAQSMHGYPACSWHNYFLCCSHQVANGNSSVWLGGWMYRSPPTLSWCVQPCCVLKRVWEGWEVYSLLSMSRCVYPCVCPCVFVSVCPCVYMHMSVLCWGGIEPCCLDPGMWCMAQFFVS